MVRRARHRAITVNPTIGCDILNSTNVTKHSAYRIPCYWTHPTGRPFRAARRRGREITGTSAHGRILRKRISRLPSQRQVRLAQSL
jgi:hypothetical protein